MLNKCNKKHSLVCMFVLIETVINSLLFDLIRALYLDLNALILRS